MIKIIVPGLELKDVEIGSLSVFWIVILTLPLNRIFLGLIPGTQIPYLENNFGIFAFTLFIALYFAEMIKEESGSRSLFYTVVSFLVLFFSFSFFAATIFNQGQLLSALSWVNLNHISTRFLTSWTLILLFEAVLLFSVTARLYDKEAFLSLLKSIKPFRTLHFVGLTFIGFVVAYSLGGNVLLDASVLLPIACMVLTWQFSTMINDFYDRETDEIVHPDRPLVKEKIDPKTFKEIGIVCAMLSLLLSLLFSVELFLINSIFVFAGVAYSKPSIRLKNRVFGHVCVGYASMTAFLFGVYGVFALNEVN
ncbi:MAG: UbiA family prenyltransferase, partial [Candidatus Thermoplasmatota archaeon]